MAKSRTQKRGGLRSGAGRPCKWYNSGKTKLVRIPAGYVSQILEVVDYMNASGGRLPDSMYLYLASDFPHPEYDSVVQQPYPRNYSDTK